MKTVDESQTARVMLLGYAVEDFRIQEICRQDSWPPMQTHRFTWRIVRGLESALGHSIAIASFAPISDYPGNPAILVRGRRWSRAEGETAVELPFVNILGLKHLTRFVVALVTLLRWAAQSGGHPRIVVNYGAASSQLYACLVARTLTSLRVVNILTDPPGVPKPGESLLVRTLRRADVALTRFALERLDGLIALTRDLHREFAPGRPCIIVEGAVDPCGAAPMRTPINSNGTGTEEFIVAYGGALTVENGVDNLLQAFLTTSDPRLRLWLFGKGSLGPRLAEAANRDDRISYFGFVTDEELSRRLRSASILVVPRPTALAVSRFVFPSKMLEYLMAGTPVASTEAEGIPREYFDFIFSLGTGTPEAILSALREVQAIPVAERLRRAGAARTFVCTTRDYLTQGRRMLDFLRDIGDGSPSRSDDRLP